ncbi:putative ADP-ribosylation factor GTPase-activating protein AGD13 [Apostasia shenzhenica]|uniref:Putative ADP-ribosylation factor GTPase-activating protein AGD13 n=1 Tax=Apostasia shenzhenica TaxID=1088818 RepID=A0A2I0B3V1_9ASPA|nr:putative ADP-ribosylation factor GTPase-activating protein AGD13 [Apostasia shenzhenica]
MVDRLLGLLKVRVVRGVNLAVRDSRSSDPYVVLRMGNQKLKTRAIKNSVNQEWDEELTLSIEDPTIPIKLEVYDKDTFTADDPMGDAEFEILSLFEVSRTDLAGIPDGQVIRKQVPSRQNCLAGESNIKWVNGKVVQELCLKLRNVESGEIELKLIWVDVPRAKGSSKTT